MSANGSRTLTTDFSRLEEQLVSVTREQPVLAVGAAAGIGFLLGGGLSRGALTMLFGVGARMASAWLEQEFPRTRRRAQEQRS